MRKKDEMITLTKEQKAEAVAKIREYIEENFETEIGNLQSELFLRFVLKHIGVYCYNQAICDSSVFMTEKADDLYVLMKAEEE